MQAELSVLVDVLHWPELLFLGTSGAAVSGLLSVVLIQGRGCRAQWLGWGRPGGWGRWPCEVVGGCPRARPSAAARLIQHTKDLMESEEKLCVKVLRTLQQMLLKKTKYLGDWVSAWRAGCQAGLATGGSGPGLPGWMVGETGCHGPCSLPCRATSCARCCYKNYLQNREVQLEGDLPDPHGHRSVLCPPC